MERASRLPVGTVAVMLVLVVLGTANLTGIGIGSGPLLYDTIALARLVPALVLTCAAWTAWFALRARRGEPLRADLVWALLGGLALWAAVSLAFSPHRLHGVLGQSERLEGLVTFVLYALVYGLTLQVVRRIGDARLLLSALGGAATLVALYGLVQFAGFEPFDYTFEGYTFETRRAFATFGNPNFLAGLLVLALPPLGALSIRARSQAVRMGWALAAVVVAAALVATFSRAAWAGAAVQAVLGGVVLWRARAAIDWRALRVPLAIGAVAFAVLVAVSAGATGELDVVRRLAEASERTGSAGERSMLGGIAIAAAGERPVTGYGPDAFLAAFRANRTDDYVLGFGARTTMNNAHAWPPQLAATLGVPGALLHLAALATALGLSARTVFRRTPRRPRAADPPAAAGPDPDPLTPSADLLYAAAWVGAAGFALTMLANVAVLGATVPFFVLLGIVGAPAARAVELRAPAVPLGGAAFASALTVAAVVASAALVTADASYLAARNAFRGLAAGDAVALTERAVALNPTSVKYSRGLAEVTAAPAASALVAGRPAEEVRALLPGALAAYERHLARHPADYPGLAWYGSLQVRAGVALDDPALVAAGQRAAQRAATLDRQNEEVFELAMGATSAFAIESAAGVLPLP